MKIAFVSQPLDGVLPPRQSSIGIWTYQIARRLAADHQVHVYAKLMRGEPRTPPQGPAEPSYHFIPAAPNRFLLKLGDMISRRGNPRRPFFAHPLYNLEYFSQIALDLRRRNVQIAHIHNFSQIVPLLRTLHPQVKIVLHMHCEWLSQLDPLWIEPRLAKTDLVIACSQYIRDRIRDRFPQYAGRCHTVFNGVDHEAFARSPQEGSEGRANGRQDLLFVGRVSPEKGLHVLLQAFERVAVAFPEARLKIVGSAGSVPEAFIFSLSDQPEVARLSSLNAGGGYLAYLHAHLPPNLAGRVTFTGPVPHEQVVRHYHEADVLVNPSFSEAFGMSLIEAMASQVPVVATRVGGMTDIIQDNHNGLLVPAGDAEALAACLIRCLSDSDLAARLREAALQKVVEQFTWTSVVDQLHQLYLSSDDDGH